MAAQALRAGLSVADIHDACRFDPWFLRELARIVAAEAEVARDGLPQDAVALRRLKALGFSDRQLAVLAGMREDAVAALRARLGVQPVYKRIDTCAAEFASATPYMYSTYEGGFGTPVCEADPTDREKIIILGGGPEPHRPGHRVRLLLRACRLRAEARPGSRPSWSTATRKPSAPTTTPPTGCISSR